MTANDRPETLMTIELHDADGATLTISSRADRKRLPKGRALSGTPDSRLHPRLTFLADHVVSWTNLSGPDLHGVRSDLQCTRNATYAILGRSHEWRQQVSEAIGKLQQPER